MGVVVFGTRAYGRVDARGGEYAQTQFFHIDFVPLVPRSSFWVTREVGGTRVGHAIKLDGKSVLATYLRVWGLVATGVALVAVPGVAGVVLAAALAGLVGWSWTWRSLRGARARRRSDWNAIAFGVRCEPERMTDELRGAFEASLGAKWTARGSGRSPNEVARHGTTDVHEAVLAYGILRLAAAKRGRAGASDRADAERLLDGAHDTLPTDAGPYREAPVDAGPAHAAAVEAMADQQTAARAQQAAVAAAAVKPRWRHRPWVQLIGLVWVSLIALGSAAVLVGKLRGTAAIGARELASSRMPTHREVAVDCDSISDPGWSVVDPGDGDRVQHRIVFCHVGERILPVEIDADAGTVDPHVVGRLRPIDGTARRPVWADGLDDDPALAAAAFDYYVDTRHGMDRRFTLVACLAMVGGTVTGWAFWIAAWRRRRRARAAA